MKTEQELNALITKKLETPLGELWDLLTPEERGVAQPLVMDFVQEHF